MLADKLELALRPPETAMPPYPPKYITLASGEKMVVHQVGRKEVPVLLETIRPLLTVARDFYDVVAARFYAELLGWMRYRVKDEYCLVGTIDGEIVGLVNGRMVDGKLGMSYHTIAIKRGLRVGAHLFAAKMEYHMEYLGEEEVYIVAESPIGYRRWMIEYELEPRPHVWHELGGVPTHVLTQPLWQKHKGRLCTGRRPVPPELLEKAKEMRLPSEYPQIPGFKR
ncbi:MAG TPA: hypothetical protein GX513_03235 [Firmicutes bacterium]|nr:hypothetical protein [Bacillota bacterium]